MRQGVLVEVNHRIRAGTPVSTNDLDDIGRAKQIGEIVHHPLQLVFKVVGDILEELLEERVCLGDERHCLVARKVFWRRVVETCGKHAVG